MSRITTDIKYSLVQFFRNRQSVFFAFIFPVMFLALAWFLFGGQSGPQALYYVDGDGSQASIAFLGSMNSTTGISLVNGSGMNLAQMLKDGQIAAYVEIPQGFGKTVEAANNSGIGIMMYYDRSRPASPVIIQAVRHAVNEVNMGYGNAGDAISLSPVGVATSGTSYAEFLLPGILGIAIMGSAVDTTVSFIAKLRATGVFRKLSITPMKRFEWNASRVITGTIISLLSVAVSLVVAWLAFGVLPRINPAAVLLVLAGSVLFVGLGMIIAYIVKGEGSANAALTITLPLIFISGSIIPADQMPWFLKDLAVISPLTYLNNGLRSAMVTGNMGDAWMNLAIVGVLAAILFGIGVAALKWRDD
ncbi:MAG TPA: ABC transporter permease [Methanocellaceae archaeon]